MSGSICVKSTCVISDCLQESRTGGHKYLSVCTSNANNINQVPKVSPNLSLNNNSFGSSIKSLRRTRSKMYKINNKDGVIETVIVNEISLDSVTDLNLLFKQQLLHPDWRKIPHRPHFGWTQKHDLLNNKLEKEAMQGKIYYIYYRTKEEYKEKSIAYEKSSKHKFLNGPTASTVIEIFKLFEKLRIGKPEKNPKLNINGEK